MKGFEKMVKEHENGTKPLFMGRKQNQEERDKIKKIKKINWYKGNKNKETDGILVKEIKKL